MRLFWLVLLALNVYYIFQPDNDWLWLSVTAAVICFVNLIRPEEGDY